MTVIWCGGIFNADFIANLLASLPMKELRKSVSSWQSGGQRYSGLIFFGHGVEYRRIIALAPPPASKFVNACKPYRIYLGLSGDKFQHDDRIITAKFAW